LQWFLQFVNDLKALYLSISGEGANDYRNVYRELKITLVPGGNGIFLCLEFFGLLRHVPLQSTTIN